MWGIVPAGGQGTRIQPLAFSKELLPVGTRTDAEGVERPRAVCEYLLERMVAAGADRICLVISPNKSDILSYFGGRYESADLCYAIQPRADGLCDSIFRALPFIADDEDVVVGLPDTVWFPSTGLADLPAGEFSFLLFPVSQPSLFDAVLTDGNGMVQEVRVKNAEPRTHWVWGAFRLSGRVLRELHQLWLERSPRDAYLGTLVNAWLRRGGRAHGVPAGRAYVDVGTLHGYRDALRILAETSRPEPVWPRG